MELTRQEIDLLLSLPESELTTFLKGATPKRQTSILKQLSESSQEQKPKAAGKNSLESYASDRSARNAATINAKTAASQEIGPLPDVANPQRRERAAADNLLFSETYFAATFHMGWAPYQRKMMDCFQDVILDGGKKCRAVRRGGAKSTCARVSIVWAAVNGHRRFPVLVGATDSKANEHRKNFFDMLQSSDLLAADYPELLPLLLKHRQPKKQFRLDGRLLELSHKDDKGRIVFPDIHESASCQTHIAPYSLMSTDVSGLSFVDRFGVTVRPDLICFDDVQTPQSAKSPTQTETREDLVTKTFMGLAGLGQKMAAINVCTVREHDDLSERFLSREKHPDWDGARYPSIIRMPDRMDLWEVYARKLTQGETPEDGKELATGFYLDNREEMDAGHEVAWELDKLADEVSSLQSLMTVRALDPEFFACEIQQEGKKPTNTSGIKLDAKVLVTRLSNVERGVVPDAASYLTGFVDSSDEVLWWIVMAWANDFTGWVVDYGTWPDQGRPIFYKGDLVTTISEQLTGTSWEEAFVHAHNELDKQILKTTAWETQSGESRNVDLLLKDWANGTQKQRIKPQVMASGDRAIIRPTQGFAPKPGKLPVHLYGASKKGSTHDRHTSSHWVERRSESPIHVQYDTNIWKTHAARRLLTTMAAPSAISLPGRDEHANKLLAEHFTSEQPAVVTYDGASGTAWEHDNIRDNDWWDCFVGNNVAASMLGCGLTGEVVEATDERRVVVVPEGRLR